MKFKKVLKILIIIFAVMLVIAMCFKIVMPVHKLKADKNVEIGTELQFCWDGGPFIFLSKDAALKWSGVNLIGLMNGLSGDYGKAGQITEQFGIINVNCSNVFVISDPPMGFIYKISKSEFIIGVHSEWGESKIEGRIKKILNSSTLDDEIKKYSLEIKGPYILQYAGDSAASNPCEKYEIELINGEYIGSTFKYKIKDLVGTYVKFSLSISK